MNFRKRNYQRGQIKRHHQQQLNALIGNKTEAEIKELHQLFLNYERTYKQAVDKFENFIRSKLTKSFFMSVCRSSNEIEIEKSENEKEIAAQKMREMNISFERKSIFGKIFETEEEELLRNKYYFANENINRLREQSSQSDYVFDYWSFKNIEEHFMVKFSQELQKEKKTLAEIGVIVKPDDDGKLNFNLNKAVTPES